MPADIYELQRAELKHILWEQLGIRVAPTVTCTDMHLLLHYTISVRDIPENPIDEMRDKLVAFIQTHKDQLSLPCNGNCYEHSDGVVLSCYRQFKEDNNG